MASSSTSDPRRRWLSPRGWGLLAAVALALLALLDPAGQRWLRHQALDGMQRLQPRPRPTAPGMVVEVDEASLAAYGQWPWPRTRIAALVERIASAGPAAIGLDFVLPEADRTAPARIAEALGDTDRELAARIAQLPDPDAVLGRALSGRRVVLGVAGINGIPPPAGAARAPPILLRGDAAGLAALPRWDSALRSRAEIEAGAAGAGVLNMVNDGSVVRRMLTLARIGDATLPAFAPDLLRVASGAPALTVNATAAGVASIDLAELHLPVERDGRVWLRYGRLDRARYRSARELMERPADPEDFRDKVVLVAITGLGMADQVATPLGELVSGTELHLQLIENLLDGSWLTRPTWARALEALLLFVAAGAMVLVVPVVRPGQAVGALLVLLALLAAGGYGAFAGGLLIDAAVPAAGAGLVFAVTLGATLAESQRQRTALRSQLALEREQAARVAGELEAARRVQVGMLPDPAKVLEGEARASAAALMAPARLVGGDFYDLFRLDGDRLCVLIGDVSGKGLPAAMFMTLVKARCQGALLRHPDALARAMADVEVDVARENPESMFVTLLVAILDLATGKGEYCNAGHEPGIVTHAGAGPVLLESQVPPIGVLSGFGFETGRFEIPHGGNLVLCTDGVTEACDPSQQLYGRPRLLHVLREMAGQEPQDQVNALGADITRFAAGAEQADDIAAVVLRWSGAEIVTGR